MTISLWSREDALHGVAVMRNTKPPGTAFGCGHACRAGNLWFPAFQCVGWFMAPGRRCASYR